MFTPGVHPCSLALALSTKHYSAPDGFDFENAGVGGIGMWNVGNRAERLVQVRKRRRAEPIISILERHGDSCAGEEEEETRGGYSVSCVSFTLS